jgi:hypothetical protein
MRRLLGLVVIVLASLTLVPAVQATTAPTVFYNIHVTLTSTRIVLDKHSAPRGTFARFILRNLDKRPHNFTLGKVQRGTGAQSGFSRTLKPRQRMILLLFLDYRGAIPYRGGLPADRSKAGMKGIFTIGGCVSKSVGC